jgi:hypothetical protein
MNQTRIVTPQPLIAFDTVLRSSTALVKMVIHASRQPFHDSNGSTAA